MMNAIRSLVCGLNIFVIEVPGSIRELAVVEDLRAWAKPEAKKLDRFDWLRPRQSLLRS